MREITSVAERPEGKIPTTSVTNEHARAINSMLPEGRSGQRIQSKTGGESSIVVMLSTPNLGLGYFTVREVVPKSGVNVSAAATLDALVDLTKTNAGPPLVAVSNWELDSVTAAAMSSSFKPLLFVAVFTGSMTSESPPREIWLIDGLQGEACTTGTSTP